MLEGDRSQEYSGQGCRRTQSVRATGDAGAGNANGRSRCRAIRPSRASRGQGASMHAARGVEAHTGSWHAWRGEDDRVDAPGRRAPRSVTRKVQSSTSPPYAEGSVGLGGIREVPVCGAHVRLQGTDQVRGAEDRGTPLRGRVLAGSVACRFTSSQSVPLRWGAGAHNAEGGIRRRRRRLHASRSDGSLAPYPRHTPRRQCRPRRN